MGTLVVFIIAFVLVVVLHNIEQKTAGRNQVEKLDDFWQKGDPLMNSPIIQFILGGIVATIFAIIALIVF